MVVEKTLIFIKNSFTLPAALIHVYMKTERCKMIIVSVIGLLLSIFGEGNLMQCFMKPNNKDNGDKTVVDCSSKNLEKIPLFLVGLNVKILDLHNNVIKMVPASTLSNISSDMEFLDLSHNQIEELDVDSFSGLVKLKILKLGHNKLCLHSDYPEGLFKDLGALQTLYTLGNKCTSQHKLYPDYTFKDLISLERLSLDVAYNFKFKSGFQKLKRLTYLEATDYECRDISITDNSFYNFKDLPISGLVLRGCAYGSIRPGSLSHFRNLTHLNLACTNRLSFASVMASIKGMPGHTIETIIFDGREITENANFCDRKFNNVKRLSIRGTGISKINMKNGQSGSCLDKLEHLNLGGNSPPMTVPFYIPIFLFPYIVKNGIPESLFWTGKRIKVVDVSTMLVTGNYIPNIYCKLIEQDFADYFQTERNKYVKEPFPLPAYTKQGAMYKANETEYQNISGVSAFQLSPSPNINVLYAIDNFATLSWDSWIEKYINRCPYVSYPPTGVVYLNFSGNNFQFLACQCVGMENLRVLDVSKCRIEDAHKESLSSKYVPSLEVLHAQENNIGKGQLLSVMFKDAKALKEINLANNNIRNLPKETFENTRALEKLDLSRNLLSKIDLKIAYLVKLRWLDLSNNQFASIHQTFRKELEELMVNGGNISIIIAQNRFTCSCDDVQFLIWIQSTNIDILGRGDLLCHDKNSKLVDVNIDELKKSCDKKRILFVIISILGGVAFMALMCGTLLYSN